MVGLTEEQFGKLLRKIMDRTAKNPPFEEDCDEEEENDGGSSEQLQPSPGRALHSSQHRRAGDSHFSLCSGGYCHYRYIFFLTSNVNYYSTCSTKEYWSRSYLQEGRRQDSHRKQVWQNSF